MHLSFEQLLSFVTIVDEGSFRGAARKLHKSQPTISTAIQHLELNIGFPLFKREQKKAILTQKGARFYEMTAPLSLNIRRCCRL